MVALWFLIFDAARGHPFETPAIVGASILHGGSDALTQLSRARLVGEYTVVHSLAFVMVGIVGALQLEAAEKEPSFTPSLVICLVAFESFFVAPAMFLGPTVIAILTWSAIVVANLPALVAMVTFFVKSHPGTVVRVRSRWRAQERGATRHVRG